MVIFNNTWTFYFRFQWKVCIKGELAANWSAQASFIVHATNSPKQINTYSTTNAAWWKFISVWTDSLGGSSSISGRSRDALFLACTHSISRGRPPLFLTFPLKKDLSLPLLPEAVRPSIKANPLESATRRSEPKPDPGGDLNYTQSVQRCQQRGLGGIAPEPFPFDLVQKVNNNNTNELSSVLKENFTRENFSGGGFKRADCFCNYLAWAF